MSFSGSFTPLQLTVASELSEGRGFAINSDAWVKQGNWTPSGYTQGTLTSTTILNKLTSKIRSVYDAKMNSSTDVTWATYRRLLTIGQNVCPALGNSRPETFKPSYAGYGSWISNVLKTDNYPPKNYPVSGQYSYVYQNYGDYAWVTGWPGKNSWQKDTDTYAAAYLPSNSEDNPTDYDEYFSNGFVATIARQAYYELWSGEFNQDNSIVNTFYQCSSYRNQQNTDIASYVNSKTFMSGTYSNINDLTTSDIAGVNQAFKVWGNDLINTGRAIYLPDLDNFGLPSSLLRNLQRNNVVTPAVKMALLYSELSTSELNNIFNQAYTPTPDQERKIYSALQLVTGDDLNSPSTGVMYGLNCKTAGIQSLADLLNPLKLFPNSYNSLTLPSYSDGTGPAKTYDFIYVNGGVNSRIQNWGQYLDGILPSDLARSCGAFSMSMRQIKNILSMDIQKFSQVVANLELTNFNLPLINLNPTSAVSIESADSMLAKIALGSGSSNSYKQCDFYGAAAGYLYFDTYNQITPLLNTLTTATLTTIYNNIYNLDLTAPGANSTLSGYITAANTEIQNIKTSNTPLVEQLNYYWDMIGKQLFIEQRAIPMAVPVTTNIPLQANDTDFTNFAKQLEEYATDNSDGQNAPILEGISDISNLGGQSIIAALREARNAKRLGLTGGDLQNDISPIIDTCTASAFATVTGGVITDVTITNGSLGYDGGNLPTITVYPVGQGAELIPVLASDGSINSITVVNGGSNYVYPQIEISPPPQCQYPNPPQQTYADTPDSRLVPPELVAPTTSSPDVATAIDDVTQCNCDCWEN